MKWYARDPSAWLAGVIGLDAEERGFYDTIIDLLYARDGKDVTDALVCQAMGCRPQVWRRVKPRLIAAGKITETAGKLMANRVETTLQTATKLMGMRGGFGGQNGENQGVAGGTTTTTSIKGVNGFKKMNGTDYAKSWEIRSAAQLAEREARERKPS